MTRTVEQSAMRKVYLRLLPLTMLMYLLCYIDRINVSFAALTMNKDIGLDAWTYGLSSTAFYVGYNDDINRRGFNPFSGQLEPGLRRNERTFFIKMSYLFRKSFGG